MVLIQGTFPRCCRSPVKATFPKDAIREEDTARSSHSAAVSHDQSSSSSVVNAGWQTTCRCITVALRAILL